VVTDLIETTGIDLVSGVGNAELARYKEHFREYKIVVYQDLSFDNMMFQGQLESTKRQNAIYDDVEWHYHMIKNLTGAKATRYAFKACNKICISDGTHLGDQTCSD